MYVRPCSCVQLRIRSEFQSDRRDQHGSGCWLFQELHDSILPCVTEWVNVTPALTVKTSNATSLFVDTSLVTGLYTSTQVKGNNTGATSSAIASATVSIRVLLDGVTYAYPDTAGTGVTFDARVQTLTADLGNIFTSACAASPTTCTLTP